MNFLLWLFFIWLGILVIRYRYVIHDFTGEWWWANTYLGWNGTVVAIVLIGMGCIAAGAAYPFGVFDGVGWPIEPTEFRMGP